MQSFLNLELVCCSMLGSNCCFFNCRQIFQEAGKVVWYSHFFKNFPQFVVIHTVKGFGIVDKAKVNIFLELSCFLMIQWILVIWCLLPLPFLNLAWTSGISRFRYCWSLAWRILKMWYIYPMCYMYTMEYYSGIKKNEIVPSAVTWMDLETVILT